MSTITPTDKPADRARVKAKVIAERYNVTERCVLNWGESGTIPRIKIGKTVRFDLDAVIAKLEGVASGNA